MLSRHGHLFLVLKKAYASIEEPASIYIEPTSTGLSPLSIAEKIKQKYLQLKRTS
jgi:hypothetical protein